MALNTAFDELLEFPCVQTFKVMGVNSQELNDTVLARLQDLAPGDYHPTETESKKGNYKSLSLPVRVESKQQMETIYTELAKLSTVKVVL